MLRFAFVMAGMASAELPEMTGQVFTGQGDNYEQWAKETPYLLVEFYAPWCGHCKKLDPEYEKAAQMLHADGSSVRLVKVDATEKDNEEFAKKYGIEGFPTLKWFAEGNVDEYDGPREAQGIVDWVKSMTGSAVSAEARKGDETLAVVYYGADATVFEEVAKQNRKKATWFHEPKEGEPTVAIAHDGQDLIEVKADTKEEIEKFFTDNSLPLFGELNGETFGTYMEHGAGLVWTLLKYTDAESVKTIVAEQRSMYQSIAKKVPGFNVTWTNTIEFEKVLESMFGLTEFPRIVVQSKAGAKKNYIYDGEMTEDKIVEYIEKVQKGEVEPHLKSEPVPEDQTGEPVKTIVGKNLQEMVFSAEKDVLLEIYAPWCGHCKKLDPEYKKVGQKVIKEGFENILTIAKMDGTLNDSPNDNIEWSGFPTMVYVKAGSEEAIKYDGARDAKGIWKWIKKNHSKSADIKKAIAEKKVAREAEGESQVEEAVEEPKAETREEL